MPVPLFATSLRRLPRPRLTEKLAEVVEGERFILGPEVAAFEEEFARYLGVRHCVGVANGTDAITIALRALGVAAGDEVVLPLLHLLRQRRGDRERGRRARLLRRRAGDRLRDRRRGRGGGDAADQGNRAGRTCSATWRRCPSCARSGLPVLEDAAQAAGATLSGARAGALGHAATFSFFPSKNLPCLGDGGAVVTDDDDVALLRPAAALSRLGRQDHVRGGRLQLAPRRAPGRGAARAAAGARRLDGQPRAGRRRPTSALGIGEHARAAAARRRRASTPTTSTWSAASGQTSWSPPWRRGDRRPRLLPRAGAPPARDGAFADGDPELPGTDEAARTGVALPMGTGALRRSGPRGGRRVRVWVDLTNSPHVLVHAAADRGDARGRSRGGGNGARLRPDAGAVRPARHRAHRRRPPPRRPAREQGARPGHAAARRWRAGRARAASTWRWAMARTTSRSPRPCCACRAPRPSTTSGRPSSTT